MSDEGGARKIAQGGVWLVEAAHRPKGWEKYGLEDPFQQPEAEPSETPILDKVISEGELAECERLVREAKNPLTPERLREEMAEIQAAVTAEAEVAKADDKLIKSARIMVAGMWTRSNRKIARALDLWIAEVSLVAERFKCSGIWTSHEGKPVVRLGNLDGDAGIVEFWCNAMVGTGELSGFVGKDGQMSYRYIGKKTA